MRAKSKDSLTTFCTIEGCGKPRRARMLCIGHYNAKYRTPNPVAEFTCPSCGATFTAERGRAKRYTTLYCSQACMGRGFATRGATVEVWKPRPVLHVAIDRMPAPTEHAPRAFVSGQCRRCREWFTDRQTTGQFCSPLCARRWHRDVRKERMGYRIPKATRMLVYKRDKHTCQLCGERVDVTLPAGHKLAPTLDHIVCTSWTLVPDHSPNNLRLAHLRCNSLRGNNPEWTGVRMSA